VAAVPDGARRLRPLRAAVVVLLAAAAARPGFRAVPDRLRRGPLHRRIRARAGCLSRPARLRLEHGAMAEPADDRRRPAVVFMEPEKGVRRLALLFALLTLALPARAQ